MVRAAAWLLLLTVAGALMPASAVADTNAGPVWREILALYDGREEPRPDQTRIHRFAEMPLNHLGFVVTYWDVNAGLPEAEHTANLHGLLIWFRRPQASAVHVWARHLVAQGTRMVVLGDGGVSYGEAPPDDASRLFQEIGFRVSGAFVDLTYAARVLHRDGLIGFEQPLDPVLPAFPIVETVGADVASHLVLEHREAGATQPSSVVLTSGRGGFIATGYSIYEEPISGRTRWIVDPFAFFRTAYGVARMPIPDVTTLSGRRMYFSHIDGDGWNNVSRIDPYHDKQTISAEVVLRELIAPYPDLPVSVGVIGADVDEKYGPVETARRVTRALFALPQVEVATHTYTHPYQWSFFENYDRELEERLIGTGESEWPALFGDRIRRLAKRLFPALSHKLRVDAKNASTIDPKTDDNTHGGEDDPPRAFAEAPFDLDQETRGAVRAAEKLAPAGKRTALYLWSGGAEPFEAAIAQTRALGVRNMNGGDSRVDADYPSISYLSPVARSVGAERQIYAGQANDFLYITDGAGRDHGYLHLDATINATDAPRRLKPVNVYYHMFAGERAAQLAAVRRHLDTARQSVWTPVAAAHYAAIADGFFSTEITALDETSWLIRNRGALETLRFDDAAGLAVDFGRSVGVLGQRRRGATLYVALDEAQEDVLLALAPAESAGGQPHLIEGRWTFRDLRPKDCGFSVMAKGFGPGQMRWGGLTPGIYRVAVTAADKTVWDATAEVGEDGRLALTADVDAMQPVDVDVTCLEPDGQD
ncbi:MAG: polysaccharide biosynthesis protein PelA [Alphaproteobacteria bacterium]|jgi:hypothetical protein|nr:polysaccharide biosynthesis protein PelA [Alphaproteobacteria bacterium]